MVDCIRLKQYKATCVYSGYDKWALLVHAPFCNNVQIKSTLFFANSAVHGMYFKNVRFMFPLLLQLFHVLFPTAKLYFPSKLLTWMNQMFSENPLHAFTNCCTFLFL